jgi:hypothetical protein
MLLVSSLVFPQCFSQPASSSAPLPSPAKPVKVSGKPSRYQPDHFAGKAGRYYAAVWGVNSLVVRTAESGELVRFSYQVLDPQKAKLLNDKKIEPRLNDPDAHVSLVIPALEKVGQLRQSGSPQAGTSYWMAFSNPHKQVKRGDRVNIVIGQFHADGLVVE